MKLITHSSERLVIIKPLWQDLVYHSTKSQSSYG